MYKSINFALLYFYHLLLMFFSSPLLLYLDILLISFSLKCTVQWWHMSCIYTGCYFQSFVGSRDLKDIWDYWIVIFTCRGYGHIIICPTTVICTLTEIFEEGRKSEVEKTCCICSSWNCQVWYDGENYFISSCLLCISLENLLKNNIFL